MFKKLRVAVLLAILLTVIVSYYGDKHQNWQKPVYIAVYPVNVTGEQSVNDYIATLDDSQFAQLGDYLTAQSQKYGINTAVHYRLGKQLMSLPPEVPKDGRVLDTMLWSLKFRYYAYKNANDVGVPTDLKLFLTYYDANTTSVLEHTSTTLQNGRIGIVHLFANQTQAENNHVVIAHETLHGFGATDKYNLVTKQPLEPNGLANPSQYPLYPQNQAEIMAVHKAISATENVMARNLDETVVGRLTAVEIGWRQ